MNPSASMVATSPVKNQPSGRSLSVHLEIGARDPGAPDHQIAKRLAIVRQIIAVAVTNADFDAEHRAPLLDLAVALRSSSGKLGVACFAAWQMRARPGSSRSCPRHAALRRHSRPRASPLASAGTAVPPISTRLRVVGFTPACSQILHIAEPDRRHAVRKGHAVPARTTCAGFRHRLSGRASRALIPWPARNRACPRTSHGTSAR